MTVLPNRLTRTAPRYEDATALPRWPLAAMFVFYPVWWVTGLGSMAWIPLAGVMALYMIRRGSIRMPHSFIIWLLFLLWMVLAVIGIDSAGRLIGFVYRASQYVAAGVAFLYVYNARETITFRYILGVFTTFWVWVVIGGFASLAFPLFSFNTPLSYVLPQGLLSNEVISEMAVRRLTQHNPNSWIVLDPRPSAPFLYTNAWGNVYSMLLPPVVCYLGYLRRSRLFVPLLALLMLSFIPAFLTLNRGMFIGIAIALVFVGFMAFLGHHSRILLSILLLGIVLGTSALALNVGDKLEHRIDVSASTDTRADLYDETYQRTIESPVFGYGAPRPSETDGMPSAGTQGQIWTIMFSFGFPALLLYLAWLTWSFLDALSLRSPVRIGMASVLLIVLVESAYYGVVANGLILSMTIAAALMRSSPPGAAEVAQPRTAVARGTAN